MKVKTALISFLFLLFPAYVLAAPEDFVISEIMYDPEGNDSSGRSEWVEVFNNSSTPVQINGGRGGDSLRFYDGSGSSGYHYLDSPAYQGSLIISEKSYFILAKDGAVFKTKYPSYSGTIIETSMSLGNSEETLGFRVGSSGSYFSDVTYNSSWGHEEGKSLEKKVLSSSDDSTNWVQSTADGGSPGEAYNEPEAEEETVTVAYPETVKINEFLPDPESGNEWVELYNSSGAAATLTNWQIDDEEGGSTPRTFNATLEPLSYYVYYFSPIDPSSISSSTFNNSGDTVRLIRPDATVFDSFNYTSSIKGYSYALISGSFLETSKPTPGEVNIFAANPNIFEGNILDIKRLPVGHDVSLTALVCVPEDLLGVKEFYVCDKDNGIKISYSQVLAQNLKVGDQIKVSSTLEESNGEKYIKTETVSLLQSQAGNVEEKRILTGEVAEPNEGMLVRVMGKMEEQSGNTFYLNDGSGRAKVYIRDSTGIEKPEMALGQDVRAVGVVSQYGQLKSGDANFRVLPRFQNDIYVYPEDKETGSILAANTQITELPQTGPAVNTYALGWVLLLLGTAGRLWLKFQFILKWGNDKELKKESARNFVGLFNLSGLKLAFGQSVRQRNGGLCRPQICSPP